jgi:hypothetical protein
MRLFHIFGTLGLLAGVGAAAGGEAPAADAASGSFRALVTYYQGHWQCEGHFANGKAITSEERFEPWLEGAWLHEIHDDRPPFTYHAHSVWGVPKSGGALTLAIYDNFGGVRSFSSDDWQGTSITFDAAATGGTASRRERFVYRRQAPAAFSFEYQVSTDGGEWRMGDHVDCRRGE